MIELTHVEGKVVANIKLYALSTCVWCKKARQLLDDLKIDYYYTYVDLLESAENNMVKDTVKQWNPLCSFPTIVINDEKCIVGFDEEKLLQEIKK
jgi:glutaredoxin-like protein NrdH